MTATAENIIDARVLVLNKNWYPVNVTRVWKAIQQVWKERALFLDPATCMTYDVDGWIRNWDDAVKAAHDQEVRLIHAGGVSMRVPEVIVCSEYRGMAFKANHRRPKFSRLNIYRRDKGRCAYCGGKFKPENLTMEHIVPRAQGGKTEWLNIVLACVPCNSRKKDRTPAQAGMKLRTKPYVPRPEDISTTPVETLVRRIGRSSAPKTWEQFLGKCYWEVELEA